MSFQAFMARQSQPAARTNSITPRRLATQLTCSDRESSFAGRNCHKFDRNRHGSIQREDSLDSLGSDYDPDALMTELVSEQDRLARLEQIWPAHQDEGQDPFDSMVKMVSAIFDVPTALISLVYDDFQWFNARVGFDRNQTPRCHSFCAHTFLPKEVAILYVQNALEDERFCTNPLVTGPPHIRFYCGAPLVTQDFIRLGTLCIIGTEPRSISVKGRKMLVSFAELITRELLKKDIVKNFRMNRMKQQHVPRALIQKLPSLDRAKAVRDVWFEHGVEEGVLVLDARTPNWNVLWTNLMWQQWSHNAPVKSQSVWQVLHPSSVHSPLQLYGMLLSELFSVKSKASFKASIARAGRTAEDGRVHLSCHCSLAHRSLSVATGFIGAREGIAPTAGIQTLHIFEGPLVILRAHIVKMEEKDSEEVDGFPSELAQVIQESSYLQKADGEIAKAQLVSLMDTHKPCTGEEQEQRNADLSTLEESGTISYWKFLQWLLDPAVRSLT